MQIKKMSSGERPREKALSLGLGALSNAEILAIIIGSGTQGKSSLEIAHELLSLTGGSLGGILRFKGSIPGFGPVRRVSILAAFELGRRLYLEQNSCSGIMLNDSLAVYRLVDPLLRFARKEQCIAIFVDYSCRLISYRQLTSGTTTSTGIDVQEIMYLALQENAGGVILVHNHPSGEPKPSKADTVATDKVLNALKVVDICLSDHLIYGGDTYYSFHDGAFHSVDREKELDVEIFS